MNIYKTFAKPILFSIHPDHAHMAAAWAGRILGKSRLATKILDGLFLYKHPSLRTEVCGVRFQNPVGLAGGFDKDCRLMGVMPHVGFGFMEVGSVTRYPYAGNKRPWSTRLPEDGSLIVNYGLKNQGASVAAERLRSVSKSDFDTREFPIVVNIAKTNNPQIKGAGTVEDYVESLRILESVADLVNINISCPNSGDGVLLCEDMGLLKSLLDALEAEKPRKPMFIKIKPDLSDQILSEMVGLVKTHPCIKGFVISNLSKNRALLKHNHGKKLSSPGGISGLPIKNLSTQIIRKIYKLTGGGYPIIGVGGIFSAEDAYEKILAGASLVELITGMVYEGPGLIKKINKGLVKLLERDGFKSVSEAVGKE